MSERSNYLTVIVSDPTKEEASALIGHPKMSAASWSHAINDRDAKDAEIAELRADKKRMEEFCISANREKNATFDQSCRNLQRAEKAESERDEAREKRDELWNQLKAEEATALEFVAERNEAREYVQKLCKTLESIGSFQDSPACAELARGALASLPSDLRKFLCPP